MKVNIFRDLATDNTDKSHVITVVVKNGDDLYYNPPIECNPNELKQVVNACLENTKNYMANER
jgi:hypothetical protein